MTQKEVTRETFGRMYQDDACLTAFDFIGKGEVELTVERIETGKASFEVAGRSVTKPRIFFKGVNKPFICPKTKMMALVMKYKPDAKSPNDLVGAKVKLKMDPKGKNPAYPGGKGPAIVVV